MDFQIDTQLKTLRSGLRQILEKEEESCNNLIIISGQPPLDEVALLIGIYLTRAGVVDNWTILYPLFQEVLKTFGIEGEDDIEFLNKLIEKFRVPNHAESFRTYLWMLSKDIKRQTETRDIPIFGVPRNTLYTLIHRGKLRVPRDTKGKYDWKRARENIEAYQKKTNAHRELADKISKRKGIKFKSAKRAIQRSKKKTLPFKKLQRKSFNSIATGLQSFQCKQGKS